MGKNVTQAQRLRWRMGFVRAQVVTALRWDDQQYADFQFEAGMEFLRYYHSCDEFVREQMSRSVVFWSWWRLNWYFREMEFLDGVAYRRRRGIAGLEESHYSILHDAKGLADVRTRWGKVMEDSYCRDLAGSLKS